MDGIWSVMPMIANSERELHWASVAEGICETVHHSKEWNRSWDTTPLSRPLDYSSFVDFAAAAGVRFYVEAKATDYSFDNSSENPGKEESSDEGEEESSEWSNGANESEERDKKGDTAAIPPGPCLEGDQHEDVPTGAGGMASMSGHPHIKEQESTWCEVM